MANLSAEEFAAKVRNYAQKTVQVIAHEVTAKVFTQLATTILQTTPVLTGHARHNWVLTIDQPATDEVAGVAGVNLTGDPLTPDEVLELQSIVEQFIGDPSTTTLYLANNAPYIGQLDQGTSAKAPAGIVQPSITASLALLRDKKGVV